MGARNKTAYGREILIAKYDKLRRIASGALFKTQSNIVALKQYVRLCNQWFHDVDDSYVANKIAVAPRKASLAQSLIDHFQCGEHAVAPVAEANMAGNDVDVHDNGDAAINDKLWRVSQAYHEFGSALFRNPNAWNLVRTADISDVPSKCVNRNVRDNANNNVPVQVGLDAPVVAAPSETIYNNEATNDNHEEIVQEVPEQQAPAAILPQPTNNDSAVLPSYQRAGQFQLTLFTFTGLKSIFQAVKDDIFDSTIQKINDDAKVSRDASQARQKIRQKISRACQAAREMKRLGLEEFARLYTCEHGGKRYFWTMSHFTKVLQTRRKNFASVIVDAEKSSMKYQDDDLQFSQQLFDSAMKDKKGNLRTLSGIENLLIEEHEKLPYAEQYVGWAPPQHEIAAGASLRDYEEFTEDG